MQSLTYLHLFQGSHETYIGPSTEKSKPLSVDQNHVQDTSTNSSGIPYYNRFELDRYTNLEDLLDGEPWEEADFAPGGKVDLVVRIQERVQGRGGFWGRREGEGYRGTRTRIVHQLGARDWLEQCGSNPCTAYCTVM